MEYKISQAARRNAARMLKCSEDKIPSTLLGQIVQLELLIKRVDCVADFNCKQAMAMLIRKWSINEINY